MYLKWGTVGEREKGMGRKWGGGEVRTQATRDHSGRESHHDAKEGFQVSKRGSGTGEGFTRQRGIVRYHCGGWPEEVNSCVLNSYMVYL
jgi:hypothetical protein